MISSSLSEETVANIEDLVKEILLRVPAETLIRFKCVSKRWLSLISTPSFCNSHTLQNPNPNNSAAFIVRVKERRDYFFISPPGFGSEKPLNLHLEGELHISDSRNGLLLCDIDADLTCLYIVNATTNQRLEIPVPVVVDESTFSIDFDTLAVDPQKPNDYKVVRALLKWEEPRRMCLQIYSSHMRSWRMIECSFTLFDIYECCNNRIHLMNSNFEMHYYDLDDGSAGVVMPATCTRSQFNYYMEDGNYRDDDGALYFGDSGGHLHLIMRRNSYCKLFDVLELESNYSGWFVKYKVNLDKLGYMYRLKFHILFLAREENKAAGDDDSCMFMWVDNELISYNIRDETFRIVIDKMDRYENYGVGPCYYTKTLALV